MRFVKRLTPDELHAIQPQIAFELAQNLAHEIRKQTATTDGYWESILTIEDSLFVYICIVNDTQVKQQITCHIYVFALEARMQTYMDTKLPIIGR